MEAALNDPAWTQVGYDPRRHTILLRSVNAAAYLER
jgi:hypothetical protein